LIVNPSLVAMKKRIFVVNDEPDINLTIKIALERENSFEVDADHINHSYYNSLLL
jgi:hypothetical protein